MFASPQTGQDISTWHDIPLYLENGLLNFICEIPKETSAKMEVATVSGAS
jgi:inorganic pyrophosphatase